MTIGQYGEQSMGYPILDRVGTFGVYIHINEKKWFTIAFPRGICSNPDGSFTMTPAAFQELEMEVMIENIDHDAVEEFLHSGQKP